MGKNFQQDIQNKLAAAIEAQRASVTPQLPPGVTFDQFKAAGLMQHQDRVAADDAKRKKIKRTVLGIAAGAALLGPAAIAKTAGTAVVGSMTRRENPGPQPPNVHPAATMVDTSAEPSITEKMYGADPKRKKGFIEKMVTGLWSILVPPSRR